MHKLVKPLDEVVNTLDEVPARHLLLVMSVPPSLRKAQQESFGHLLFTCARLFDEAAQERLNAVSGERIGRPAVMRLLPHLDRTGIRPTELARRVDVSKQAVGQILAEFVKRGLVEYIEDPTDKRARLVRLTRAGVNASQRGLAVLADLERVITRRVGVRTMKNLRAGLQEVLNEVESLPPAKP